MCVPPAGILSGLEKETACLGEIVPHLEKLYCGGIGLEVAQMMVKATLEVVVTNFIVVPRMMSKSVLSLPLIRY